MKCALIPCVLLAALTAGSTHAFAAPPEDITGGFPVECQNPDFQLWIEYSGKYQEIPLPDGDVITIFPKTTATVTNPSDESKSARYVITGTSRIEFLPGGATEWVSRGSHHVIVPETFGPGAHEAGLLFTRGNINFALDAAGSEARAFPGSRNVIDVCEALG